MTDSPVIALTGAAGFIGSHVAAVLSASGVRLRLLAGDQQETRRVLGVNAEVCLRADVTDRGALDELLRGATTVIHAAGPSSVAESFQRSSEYMRIHAVGTATLLEACVHAGVRRVIHISSAEVYGNDTPNRVPESLPLAAASPYGAAKIGAEAAIRAAAAGGALDAIVVRPFSVYGPGMSTRSVLAEFITSARTLRRILVRDPTPVRDFCFIADVAVAIAAACDAPIRRFAAVNVGTGTGTSIGQLAQLVADMTGLPGWEPTTRERPASAEMSRLVAKTDAAHELLGWRASTSLRDGVAQTIRLLESR